ncbi:hypothetical protein [Phycicoccus sp. SLBN-51]|uniref:hypothetical protein n=1 Tax=Phycicoccus sp. SLBN-51 TaxID=2768447 RepID=UPI00115266A8|nr:hypothetical protein [Phycicoccus sp. SLBN-51]TQJ48534.1 hypothetical protein FBY26_0189 [Phycicoccus sp. SLBN-51]
MRRTSIDVWQALPQPFLASEARAAGCSFDQLRGACERDELTKVAPCLYAVTEGWDSLTHADTHRALCRAAAASLTDVVLSHLSAAVLFGLPHPVGPLGKVSLTALKSTRTSYPDDWRRVLQAETPADHVTERAGLPVTRGARTVIDCFRQLRLLDSLAIADAAVRNGLACPHELRAMRNFQTRWPGVQRAERGLPLVDGRRESWLESASVAVAHELGYPRPASQVSIHRLDGSFVGRVDFLWLELGVVGEADGMGKYLGDFDAEPSAAATGQRVLLERDRERGLEALGFAVARWGAVDLRGTGDGLARHLAEARRRARPQRISCLWRQDPGEPLQEWKWPPPPPTVR